MSHNINTSKRWKTRLFASLTYLAVSGFGGLVWGTEQPGWLEAEGEPINFGFNYWDYNPTNGLFGMGGEGVVLLALPDAVSPDIEELARNLQHNPKLIYEFVHNKIDYVPYYGFMKGASRTLVDRAGNDADIASLLVALLRASGYSAGYKYGYQILPTMGTNIYTAAKWFDVEDVASAVYRTMGNNSIPGTNDATWTTLDRVWVETTVSGTVHQLDAAMKPRERKTRMNFADAMGYNRSTLLTAAGGVVSNQYVRNLNETNISQVLKSWSTNLNHHLKTQQSDREIEDLLGMSEIVELSFHELPTAPPVYTVPVSGGSTPPTNLLHKVRIRHGGIDRTFSMADIANKRLSITYTNDVAFGFFAQDPEVPELSAMEPTPEAGPEPEDPLDPEITAIVPDDEEVELLSTFNFGTVVQGESVSFYQSFTGNSPNASTTYRHSFSANPSGAYSVSPSYVALPYLQAQNVYFIFSGVGQSRGTKTATMWRHIGWIGGNTNTFGPYDLTGFVAETLVGKLGVTNGEFDWDYLNAQETQTVSIKNNGSQTLSGTVTGLGGSAPGRYQILSFSTPHNFSLAPGAIKSFQVRYNRDQYGYHFGTVRMSFTYDGVSYQQGDIIGLYGWTKYQPSVQLTSPLDFGYQYYLQPAVATGLFKNVGSQTLQITSVALTGSDQSRFEFTSGNSSGNLTQNQTRNIGVRYKANSVGLHTNAAIRVTFVYDEITYVADMKLAGQTISQGRAQLWLDDTLEWAESGSISGAVASLIVSIDHPYYGFNNTYLDQSVTFNLKRGANYTLLSDFGTSRNGNFLDARQRILDGYRRSGLSDSSRQVLTETLQVLGQTWMRQSSLADDVLSRISNVRRTYHHRFGVMAQEEGYYVDIKAQVASTIARDGVTANESVHFRAGGLTASALEHGILEQLQGTNKPAASTVKLLQLANASNKKVFLAASNTFSSIQSQLTNYSASVIADLQNRVNQGQIIVLPEDARIVLGDWRGAGYIANGPSADGYSEIGMIIEGDYYGGYSVYQGNVNSVYAAQNYRPNQLQASNVKTVPVIDPVDIASGNLLYDRADLVIGDGLPPKGISFHRYYNSGQINLRSPLGFGWHHNLDILAQVRSEGSSGLGLRTPVDAAALLVATVAIEDVIRNENSAKGWLTASLVAKWAIDQLNENAVSIQVGDQNLEFVRLPDGSYSPPPGSTASLTKSNGLFQLHQRHGVKLEFNSQNRLSEWKDADNNTMSLTYTAKTNVNVVTDAFGRTMTFAYDGTGSNLVSVTDNSSPSRSVLYAVVNGNLTNVTDAEGFSWSFTYDTQRRMLTQRDPAGQLVISNSYSAASGKVLSQRNAVGTLWNMYVVPQYRGVEQDPLGNDTTYLFDNKTRQFAKIDPLGYMEQTVYDGQNRVILNLDARQNWTFYQYDRFHNLTNMIDALSNASAFTYDGEHRLIKTRNALGHENQIAYDAEHHPIQTLDALSNETAMTYYPNGLLETVTGPRGEVASYTYDSYGNPTAIAKTDGGTELRTWNTRGDLLTAVDANSNTNFYTSDKRRLQTSVRDPYGNASSNIYNSAGLLVTNINPRSGITVQTWTPTYKLRTVKYPDTGIVSNTYDAVDRVMLVRDQVGGVSSNQYDAAGRLIKVVNSLGHATLSTYDEVGNVVAMQDDAGHTVSNVYDELNRLVVSIDPLGHSITNEYDAIGRMVATVDQQGKRTDFQYDALGRLILQSRSGIEHVFEYDASGNRTAYVNPKSERMGFGFDKMNRTVAETNAIGEITRYVYDPGGNLIQRTDSMTRNTDFSYDKLNRVILKSYPNASTVVFQYDPSGNLTNLVDGVGTTKQTFDSMNRLIRVVDPFGLTVTNQYDLAGRRTHLIYPGGNVQQFAYDANHRLTNVNASAFGISFVSYAFDNVNNLTGMVRPGGLTSSFSYDPLHRITAYTAHNGVSNFIQRTLTRNALGFKTVEQIQAGLEVLTGASEQAHQHDAADRITDVDHSGPGMDVTPWYDANGNVTQMVQVVQTQAGSISFTNRYEYDFDNRLVAVVSPVLVAQYVYDGLGNLLQITEAGSVRRFVRDRADGLTRPLAEMSASNTLVRSYLWANGALIAQVEAGGSVRYAHFNELGHLLALSTTNGVVTDQFSYHPYGRLVARTGTTETRFGYMAASGVMRSGYDLYLTRHRAYSGNLMRFLGRDPAGLAGGWNLYIYASGNPALLIDPSGLCAETFHPGYISSPSDRREQEIASSWGTSIGFGGTMSPDMMRSVSLDWALTIPTAAAGGLIDDAVRSVIGAVRGGGSVISREAANIGAIIPDREIANFIGRPNQIALGESEVLYGIRDAGSRNLWWSRTQPAGELQWRMDQAVLPQWNQATHIETLTIPRGQSLIGFEGPARSQSWYLGGGNQVYIPDVPSGWSTIQPWGP